MLLILVAPAFALTCTEVVNMWMVNVPTPIIVNVIGDAESIRAADVQCMRDHKLPAEIVAAAEKKVPKPR
jgi:hypothetical protein